MGADGFAVCWGNGTSQRASVMAATHARVRQLRVKCMRSDNRCKMAIFMEHPLLEALVLSIWRLKGIRCRWCSLVLKATARIGRFANYFNE